MRRRGRGANVSVTFYCLVAENSIIQPNFLFKVLIVWFHLLLTLREFLTTLRQKLDSDLGSFDIVVSGYLSCVMLQVRL